MRPAKAMVFALEGVHSFAVGFFFQYFYFLSKEVHGFTETQNLYLAACGGFTYMTSSLIGGKFGERFGYHNSILFGFIAMCLATTSGLLRDSHINHLAAFFLNSLSMGFTWASLEALATEKEPRHRLPTMVGIYNIVWAGTGALGYFVGGAIINKIGYPAIFMVPACIHATQAIVCVLLRRQLRLNALVTKEADSPPLELDSFPTRPVWKFRVFLNLSRLSNPFGFIAITAAVPRIPEIAEAFNLSTTMAGVFCSTWQFARAIAFLILWQWEGWHYKARWLFGSFAALIVSFIFMMIPINLGVLFTAQIVFGFALGLIYYSSLYYSMDAGDNKGEHGGIHEAAIGAGACSGPLIGALALTFFPGFDNAAAWAVFILMLGGFSTAAGIWKKSIRS